MWSFEARVASAPRIACIAAGRASADIESIDIVSIVTECVGRELS